MNLQGSLINQLPPHMIVVKSKQKHTIALINTNEILCVEICGTDSIKICFKNKEVFIYYNVDLKDFYEGLNFKTT